MDEENRITAIAAIDADEGTNGSTVEVLVLWGSNVLHVTHLSPPRSFFVGSDGSKRDDCDYVLPEGALAERAALVLERDGRSFVVVPHGATATFEVPGQTPRDLGPSTPGDACAELEILPGARARVQLPGSEVVLAVNAVSAGKRVGGGWFAAMEGAAFRHVSLSFLAHVGIVTALAFFVPQLGADEQETLSRDQLLLMRHYLDATQPDEPEEVVARAADAPQARQGGTDGQRARDQDDPTARPQRRDADAARHATREHLSSAPTFTREALHNEVFANSILSVIASGRPNEPSAWSRGDSSDEPFSGSVFNPERGDSDSPYALSLSDDGPGGGVGDQSVGVGHVRTMFDGTGCIPGQPCATGSAPGWDAKHHGRLQRGHQVKVPPLPRMGVPEYGGSRIPPEVIQRIVRQHYGRFRNCYETALRTNPTITGRVLVNFTIGRDGAVALASDGGSDLPDQAAIACVTRGFLSLSFPPPEGGIVTVRYPLMFTPE